MTTARPALALTLPDGLLVAAALVTALWPTTLRAAGDILPYYRYGVLALAVLLALRFDQGRVLLVLVALALADRGFVLLNGDAVPTVLAVGMGLTLAGLSVGDEHGVLAPRTAIKLGGVLAVAAATLVATRGAGDVVPWLARAVLPASWTPLSGAALVVLLGAAGFLATRFLLRPNALDRGLLWTLIAAAAALHATAGSAGAELLFGTGGLVLVVAMVDDAYTLAYRDGLIGLPSRRAFDRAVKRLGKRYTVAMVDVDRFKRFNDDHGHDVGDQVLRLVATRLRRTGGGGRVYRYGGEEFAILFPGKPAGEVLPHLEAARATVEAAEFALRARDRPKRRPKRPRAQAPRRLSVTVSIGVAEASGNHTAPAGVVEQADQALYRAKKDGRNRLSVDR